MSLALQGVRQRDQPKVLLFIPADLPHLPPTLSVGKGEEPLINRGKRWLLLRGKASVPEHPRNSMLGVAAEAIGKILLSCFLHCHNLLVAGNTSRLVMAKRDSVNRPTTCFRKAELDTAELEYGRSSRSISKPSLGCALITISTDGIPPSCMEGLCISASAPTVCHCEIAGHMDCVRIDPCQHVSDVTKLGGLVAEPVQNVPIHREILNHH